MAEDVPTDRLDRIGTAGERSVYYDDVKDTYHVQYDVEAYEPVSTILSLAIESVLELERGDPDGLRDCVDPDALNAIFIHWRGDEPRVGDGTVSFTYADCAITVRSDGEIVIDPQRERAASK